MMPRMPLVAVYGSCGYVERVTFVHHAISGHIAPISEKSGMYVEGALSKRTVVNTLTNARTLRVSTNRQSASSMIVLQRRTAEAVPLMAISVEKRRCRYPPDAIRVVFMCVEIINDA